MGRLDGKVAVVTGANSGIGLATARRFAQEGARVFVPAFVVHFPEVELEVQLEERMVDIVAAGSDVGSARGTRSAST